jgi:hypothetical protein
MRTGGSGEVSGTVGITPGNTVLEGNDRQGVVGISSALLSIGIIWMCGLRQNWQGCEDQEQAQR